jgi:hypothetical protein
VAVVRDEAGDELGAGSAICEAPRENLGRWSCKLDPRKYDSPLLFTKDDQVYVVGRRHLTENGSYDRHFEWAGRRGRVLYNEARYIWEGKRCSLWRYVRGEQRLAFVLDLPSKGDTCFAAAVDGPRPDQVVLYNYSSALEGPDYVWNVGQRNPTHIYRHTLRFVGSEVAAE